MKCNFCNTEMQDDAKFCPSCGSAAAPKINNVEVPVQADTGEPVPAETTQQPGENNNTGYYGEQPQSNANQQNSYGQYNQQGSYNQYNQQPPYYGQKGPAINGTTYLVLSILATLLCCLPLGIVSIIYSTKISSMQNMGDYMGAEEAARKAKIFIILASVLGVISNIVLFFIGIGSIANY